MSIAVRDVTEGFGSFAALDCASLGISEGGYASLLGPYGSSKTTLLRITAGLEHADAGAVLPSDDDITRRSARDRNVGFVFQHYALFRHMTVFGIEQFRVAAPGSHPAGGRAGDAGRVEEPEGVTRTVTGPWADSPTSTPTSSTR